MFIPKNPPPRPCNLRSLILSFLLVMVVGGTAQAQSVNIANVPLFLVPAVMPALILAVDDSGSMDSEILARTNDGAMWWHTNANSFTGFDMVDQAEPGRLNFNRAGGANATWKKFVYLFPNGTSILDGRRAYSDSTNDHYAVPPIGPFAYARSPKHNASYFNPATLYQPWPNLGGYTFSDSSPTNAKTDPTRGTETFNLTVVRELSDGNHVFKMYPGMTIPAGTRYRDWITNTWTIAPVDVPVDQERNVPISYFPATFFLPADESLPSDFGYSPAKANIGGVVGSQAVVDGSAPDGTPMIRYEIKPENFFGLDLIIDTARYEAAIQNFANWFTYYRKRHIATRGAIGNAFKDIYDFRLGAYRINSLPNPASSLTIWDLSVGADRTAFFYEIYWNFIRAGGTPNRQAVNHMRAQFARTDANAPIQLECQMNFGLLFTDGYANNWTGAGVENRDGEMGSPFADSVSNTMADIGMALYLDNPRPLLPQGRVPVPAGCPNPKLDCNTDLHVNLFGLTMGSPGTIFKVNEDATEDPFTHPPTWPTSFTDRNPVHVDDLWHATINSRGLLVDVEIPSELGERFTEILNEIATRLESGATSAAASSAVLQTDTLLYIAGFRSDDWSGELKAYELTEDGAGALAWDAEDELSKLVNPLANPTTDDRKIFTRAATGSGVGGGQPFQWSNLHEDQQAALDRDPNNAVDSLGQERVAWLRRGAAHASFRDRSALRLLGDIIHSDPQYKKDVLYVGANDGMLHAFDAQTGKELFAYIPSPLLLPEPGQNHAPLSRLMDPDYVHRYFVDGKAVVADVGSKTYLVGSMGAGGRTVFALDVTTPDSFSASDVMWEFSHPELGYNVGQPAIVRMSNGTWAAVFGNGYNSNSGKAALFVVDLANGDPIKIIETNAQTANGLASPFVTDWPEMNLRANRIYAGDLLGNLWAFDVSGASNEWTSRLLFEAKDANGDPQPITSKPHGARIDSERVMIAFGTGSYFRSPDATDTQVQSLYGIIDHLTPASGPVDRASDLLQQEIIYQDSETFGVPPVTYTVRVLSDYTIDPDDPEEGGWFIDLNTETGERVINGPRTLGQTEQRVRFTTMVPDEDPCGTGQRGFLMDIDLLTGGRTSFSVFDLDGDGEIDEEDMINITINGETIPVPVSGVAFGRGESVTAVDLQDSDQQLLIPGDGEDIVTGLGEGIPGGRQSWRQLR